MFIFDRAFADGHHYWLRSGKKTNHHWFRPRLSLLNKAGKVLSGIRVKYDDFMGSNTDSEETVGKLTIVTLEPKQTAVFQIFYNDGLALDSKILYPTAGSC